MNSEAAIIPGAREPGMLTKSEAIATSTPAARDEPSTMDLVTIAERQREGGGAPSQRRAARVRSMPTGPGGTLHGWLVAARLLFVWRFRTNHV
nr:hypothetical protein [uncultured bacterium]